MATIFEVLRRAEDGPYIKEHDFDMKLFKTTSRLVKEHGVTFNPDVVLAADDQMADGLFEAGLRLALEMGMFCTDTSRIIEFSDGELRQALKLAHKRWCWARARNARILRARRFDDGHPDDRLRWLPRHSSARSTVPAGDDVVRQGAADSTC